MNLSTCNHLPSAPVLDFGLKLSAKKPKTPKELSQDEAISLFGVSRAVKMNFVPQMLIAIALDQTTQFVNYCRVNKIKQFRKHNRLIQECVEVYTRTLSESFGSEFQSYLYYVRRFFEYIEVDRFRMWCSIGNVVSRQLSDSSVHEGATHIAIIHNLLNYAEKYERKMDKLISDMVNGPVCRKQDSTLKLIIAMCIEFEEIWGLSIGHDTMVETNIKVISNRANCLADTIIAEENVRKS